MERMSLTANLRQESGKIAARRMRAAGLVPAVLYGRGREPMNLTVPIEEAKTALAGGAYATHLFEVKVADGAPVTVMITEVQRHPINRKLLNIDFHAVSLTEKIHVNVPLTVTGEPVGLKRGGIIERVHTEIEVACLPTQMPDRIEVDISALDIGDAIHARDLPLSEGVELVSPSPDDAVIHLLPPAKAIEEVAAPAEEGAEPEVVSQKGEKEEE